MKELSKRLRQTAETNARIAGSVSRLVGVGVAGVLVSAGGLFLTYQSISQRSAPVATLYLRLDTQGKREKTRAVDPKLEVKFGNIGNSTMFMKSFRVEADGEPVASLTEALAPRGTKDNEPRLFQVSSDSTKALTEAFKNNHPLASSPGTPATLVSVCTVRPRQPEAGTGESGWYEQFVAVSKQRNVKVCVEFDNGLSWPFQNTKTFEKSLF